MAAERAHQIQDFHLIEANSAKRTFWMSVGFPEMVRQRLGRVQADATRHAGGNSCDMLEAIVRDQINIEMSNTMVQDQPGRAPRCLQIVHGKWDKSDRHWGIGGVPLQSGLLRRTEDTS